MSVAVATNVSDRPSSGSVRQFKDVFPGILEECTKYMHASKWYNLEKFEPDLVKLWISQLSIWTRTSFKVRGHVFANCPHPELRMALLEVVAEEDIVDPRVGMNHRQLLATSLGKASGQSLEDLSQAKPLATTLITFDILYGIANRTWEEGIALASGMERVMQESGYFGFDARRLQRDMGWSDADVAWFSGHDEADVEHGAVIELLDKYITDDRTWELVREAIIESWIAWWVMLDGIVDAHKFGIKPVNGVSCKGLSTVF
jgi:pyrroloquinoline quinone (PQQ) biosynthesis protein C